MENLVSLCLGRNLYLLVKTNHGGFTDGHTAPSRLPERSVEGVITRRSCKTRKSASISEPDAEVEDLTSRNVPRQGTASILVESDSNPTSASGKKSKNKKKKGKETRDDQVEIVAFDTPGDCREHRSPLFESTALTAPLANVQPEQNGSRQQTAASTDLVLETSLRSYSSVGSSPSPGKEARMIAAARKRSTHILAAPPGRVIAKHKRLQSSKSSERSQSSDDNTVR